jgi:hypothetical protein
MMDIYSSSISGNQTRSNNNNNNNNASAITAVSGEGYATPNNNNNSYCYKKSYSVSYIKYYSKQGEKIMVLVRIHQIIIIIRTKSS